MVIAVRDPVREESPVERAAGVQPARWHLGVALLLLGLHAVLAWLGRAPGILTRQDDSMYTILARAMLSGAGYREIHRVDLPFHSMYPPGYPAQLAAWGTIFGHGYDTLVLFSVVCSTVALGLAFLIVRRRFSPELAILSLAVLAFNPYLNTYAGEIASEAPYMLSVMLALFALAVLRPSSRAFALVGGAAIVAALSRAAGLTVVLAIGVHLLLERRWKAAAIFTTACCLTIGPWIAWTAVAPEQYVGASYVADAATLVSSPEPTAHVIVKRIRSALSFYGARMLPYTMGFPTIPDTPIDNILGAGLTGIGLLVGLWLALRKWRPAAFYLVIYLALVVIWPWRTHRFLVPLLPVTVPVVLAGVSAIAARVKPRLALPATVVFALVLTVNAAFRTGAVVAETQACDRSGELPPDACMRLDQASYFAAIRYINEHTSPDAVFYTAKPEPLYLYTARRTVDFRPALALDTTLWVESLRASGVDYVLAGSLRGQEHRAIPRVVVTGCRELALEAFFPARTYLFRVAAPGDTAGADAACRAAQAYREANRRRDFDRDP